VSEPVIVEPPGEGRGRLAAVVASGLAVLGLLAAVAVLLGGGLLGDNGMDPAAGSSAAAASASASVDPVPTTPVPTPSAKPWRVVRVGEPVTVALPFTDPGTNDTHRCDITWGDGTAYSGPAKNHECRATHAYQAAGTFTIRVVVTDDDGGSAEAPGLLVVVSGPSGPPR
jgi:hypothetical protein